MLTIHKENQRRRSEQASGAKHDFLESRPLEFQKGPEERRGYMEYVLQSCKFVGKIPPLHYTELTFCACGRAPLNAIAPSPLFECVHRQQLPWIYFFLIFESCPSFTRNQPECFPFIRCQ